METNITEPAPTVEGLAVTRIVVGTETIEFLDERFVASFAESELQAEAITGPVFLMGDLSAAWSVMVQVPVGGGSPPVFGSRRVLDWAPTIARDENGALTVTPYEGPTVGITIGQAVLALAAYADMIRAGTLPEPPV